MKEPLKSLIILLNEGENVELNLGQKTIIQEAIKWFKSRTKQVFQYSGPPGTGKTTTLKEIVRNLNIDPARIAPMSYIGAAVMNMRRNGLLNARTIHSWLFNPTETAKRDENGKVIYNEYFNTPETTLFFSPKPLHNIDLIILDEASSCPANLRPYIESHGIPIIATGDLDQLPPVRDNPAYLYDEKEVYRLTEIMRQSQGSAIIQIAYAAKDSRPINNGYYNDALVIYEDELTNEMLLNADIIICGKNETKEYYNNYIRSLYGLQEESLPVYNEKVICRRNNWGMEVEGISLANGLIGRVNNFPDVTSIDYHDHTFMMDFKPLITSQSFGPLLVDYKWLTGTISERDRLRYSKYSKGNKFEYAYAITSHLSQGSQFNNVIYIEEYLNKDINAKLNYVGATRASNYLIYVKKRGRNFTQKKFNQFY